MFKRPLCFVAIAFVAAVYIFLFLYPPDYSDSGQENGEYITISGKVTSKDTGTDFDGNQVPVLYIKESGKEDTIVKVYLSSTYKTSVGNIPQIGEVVDIQGDYYAFARASNPGEFDSRVYYKILKIEYQIREGYVQGRNYDSNSFKEELYRIRTHFSNILDTTFDTEDASVMKAMLLGDRTSMDQDIKGLYQGAGIIHILSISGLHISILGMGLYKLIRKLRIGVLQAAAISIAVMMTYGIMCGMGTSAIRAIIMFGLHMLATVIGRTYDMLTAMAVAAILLIIEQPLYIYHSGFMMSFGAVIGIGLILPSLSHFHKDDKKKQMDKLIRNSQKLTLKDYLIIAKEKLAEGALSIIKASASVSAITLPVQMNTYYTFPVYSTFLNILVIPFMTILLGLGIIVLISGSIANDIAAIPGFLCHIILSMYKIVCLGSRMLPFNTWYAGCAKAWQVVCYYVLLIIFIIFNKYIRQNMRLLDAREKRNMYETKNDNKYKYLNYHEEIKDDQHEKDVQCGKEYEYDNEDRYEKDYEYDNDDRYEKEDKNNEFNNKIKNLIYIHKLIEYFKYKRYILVYLIPVIAVIILSVRIRPELRMTFLHVGQGDGIVIEMDHKTYLIDGGSTSRKNVGKYILTPYLKYEGIGYIDACIITHEDTDHISGVMELLEAMPNGGIKIGSLILPDCAISCREDHYKELEEAAMNAGVPVSYIKRGDQLVTGNKDITITCEGPEQGLVTEGANAHSTVLFLRYGEFTSLLTGDVEEEGLTSLNRYMEQNEDIFSNITLLKVPHHGSRYTTDEEFLRILNPSCSVISAGSNNMYGHPHEEVLERLGNIGSLYYITYEKGAITVDSDGRNSKMTWYIRTGN